MHNELGYSFGFTEGGRELSYRFNEVPNFNAIFLGTPGSGKTYTLQKVIKKMPSQDGVTVHILDNKDDFSFEGFMNNGLAHDMEQSDIQDIDFSYVNGNAGLNLFQFSMLPQAGGVYMAIREVIEICKLFNSSFSSKMSNYLALILKRVYSNCGIVHEEQSSWTNDCPGLHHVMEEIDRVIALNNGEDPLSGNDFWTELARLVRDFPDESAGALTDKAFASVSEIMLEMAVPDKDTYYRGWSKQSLSALRDTIGGMIESKLFSRQAMSRRPRKINRYCLTGIAADHLKIVVRVVLNQTFNMAARQTYAEKSHNQPIPKHVIISDEAKYLKQIGQDEMSPNNRILTEGRGYGLGLWAGIQSTSHVSEDFLKTSALKTILKVEEAGYKEAIRDLGISRRQLQSLVAKKNRYVNIGGNYKLVHG